MKAVPAKAMAFGMAVVLCAVATLLLGSQPRRAAAESLQVTTTAWQDESGQIQLDVTWRWEPPFNHKGWGAREELLAISYDTRTLAWMGDDAPHGRGASGEALQRLETVAGSDGARRLFVIPEGVDGSVRLTFQVKEPGTALAGDPFKVFVVFDSEAGSIWKVETALPGAGQMTHY